MFTPTLCWMCLRMPIAALKRKASPTWQNPEVGAVSAARCRFMRVSRSTLPTGCGLASVFSLPFLGLGLPFTTFVAKTPGRWTSQGTGAHHDEVVPEHGGELEPGAANQNPTFGLRTKKHRDTLSCGNASLSRWLH